MAKAKQLTDVEKKYLDLHIESVIAKGGKVTEEDLTLAANFLKKSFNTVKDYIDLVVSKTEPQVVEKIPVSPLAQAVRKQFSPREGMAMMNPSLSETIDKNPANYITKSRNDGAIYRGNPKSN
jgi:hypothetical protein